MSKLGSKNGLLLLVTLAAAGVLLVWLPPMLAEQYDRIKSLGPPWTYFYFALIGTGAAILLTLAVMVVWKLASATWMKEARQSRGAKDPSQLSAGEQRQEVADNLAAVADLQAGAALPADVRQQLESLVARVEEKQASQKLEIVAFGTISSGKSSLLNALAGRDVFQTDPRGGTTQQRLEIPWPNDDRAVLVDTPGLGEVEGAERVAVAAQSAEGADLVLLVVDGPLRQSEHELLAKLGAMEKRVLVCLSKADWYDDDERQKLLGQISGQVHDYVAAEDVLAVRSQPTVRTRVRVLAGGDEHQEQVPVPPDIGPLARRMLQVVRTSGNELVLANLLLRSRGLVEEARRQVQESLDRRAWELVDRYTWACGAVAALSPLPVLDLFASSALTAKMVVDLARVYRQEMDLNIAVNLLAQLGKNLIAILGVNAAAPAVAAAVASLLKTIPLAGSIAGGALQGLVQALVTRWIGAVFIGYFQAEMKLPPEGLANLARQEWQRLTNPAELLKFLQEARSRLRGEPRE
ncbi:MAG TPA: GTP-binding protein [Pirellulaceae bacterium]|nr:GTP-binding protein [Pirellulaceae bacterium]